MRTGGMCIGGHFNTLDAMDRNHSSVRPNSTSTMNRFIDEDAAQPYGSSLTLTACVLCIALAAMCFLIAYQAEC